MTDYLARKLAQLCTYPGCRDEALDDHNQCRKHRDGHRGRNRACMRRARAFRRAQIQLPGVG